MLYIICPKAGKAQYKCRSTGNRVDGSFTKKKRRSAFYKNSIVEKPILVGILDRRNGRKDRAAYGYGILYCITLNIA